MAAVSKNSLGFYNRRNLQKLSNIVLNCKYAEISRKKTKTDAVSLQPSLKEFLISKKMWDTVPDRFLRIKALSSSCCFIVDEEAAEKLAQMVEPHLRVEAFQIENCPGLGIFTRCLLERVKKVTLCNNASITMSQLPDSILNRICLLNINFFDIFNIIHSDKLSSSNRFEELFSAFGKRSWNDDPGLQVFGIMLSDLYLTRFSKAIMSNEKTLLDLGRIEQFLLISNSMYELLINASKSRIRKHFLFNILFDVDILGKIPRKAVLPWDSKMKSTRLEDQYLHVAKFTPKSNLFDDFTTDNLHLLWHFLTNFAKSKENQVIGFFEQWAPGSGLKLIAEGLTTTSQVGDLSAAELVHLFKVFFSLPQVNRSIFETIQENEPEI